MSFFPGSLVTQDSSFHPLFRLLDDFDTYRSSSANDNPHTHQRDGNIMKSFTPKFDVREVGDSYQLHGELPGVEQSDIEIEFTDAQTLQIKGRTERTYSSGTPPVAATTRGESIKETTASHQPTVEDENVATAPAEGFEVTRKEAAAVTKQEPREKYWVSERSVGEFSRSFTFPVRVDSEQVHASMKNGILDIVVPKAKKDQARKISIH